MCQAQPGSIIVPTKWCKDATNLCVTVPFKDNQDSLFLEKLSQKVWLLSSEKCYSLCNKFTIILAWSMASVAPISPSSLDPVTIGGVAHHWPPPALIQTGLKSHDWLCEAVCPFNSTYACYNSLKSSASVRLKVPSRGDLQSIFRCETGGASFHLRQEHSS